MKLFNMREDCQSMQLNFLSNTELFPNNPTLSAVSTPFLTDLPVLPTRPGKAVMSVCVIIQSLSEFHSGSVLLGLHCLAVGNEAYLQGGSYSFLFPTHPVSRGLKATLCSFLPQILQQK